MRRIALAPSIQGIEGSSPSSPANSQPEHDPTGAGRHEAAPDAVADATYRAVRDLGLICRECGDVLALDEIVGHLASEGRAIP